MEIEGDDRSATATAQVVQAEPRRDRRDETCEVVDRLGIDGREPQPRLLHNVIGVVGGAQHPIGERSEPWALLLETGCQFSHGREPRHTFRIWLVITLTNQTPKT